MADTVLCGVMSALAVVGLLVALAMLLYVRDLRRANDALTAKLADALAALWAVQPAAAFYLRGDPPTPRIVRDRPQDETQALDLVALGRRIGYLAGVVVAPMVQ